MVVKIKKYYRLVELADTPPGLGGGDTGENHKPPFQVRILDL